MATVSQFFINQCYLHSADWVSARETPGCQQLNQSLLPSCVIRATLSSVLTRHTPPFGGADSLQCINT